MTTSFSDDNFTYMQKFLLDKSGYYLTENKRYLLESRLKPLLEKYNLPEFDKIVNMVQLNPKSAISLDVIESMTINETFFFRDDTPFRILRENVLPNYLKKPDKMKIWSAACSTGQEPYSIAIVMEEIKRKYPDVKYEIHASDINKTVVEKAKVGSFSEHEVNRGLPGEYKNRYFEMESANQWKIKNDMRHSILFFIQNLCDGVDNFRGPYDIVFLRNVLIYFNQDLKLAVLKKISKSMAPDGYLFLGTSENIYDQTLGFERQPELSGIYRKKI